MDTAVALVKTYLELCGYFVLAELPVRAPGGGGYRDVTDLDVIAVRFPHPTRHDARRTSRPLDVFLGEDPVLGATVEGVDVLIGEVKEGAARLNPALRRAETVAFALRRAGCCAEETVDQQARLIARDGERELAMPGRVRCRVRLVAFGGHGTAMPVGVQTVSLAHCARFIAERLRAARDVLAGAQFKDPVLGRFALQDKITRQETGDHAGPRATPDRQSCVRPIS